MFIELIDSLRCPHPHEDSWLVGSFDRMDGRDVVGGRLGCPICRAEFPIEQGVVRFDARTESRGEAPTASGAVHVPDPERAMRAAAFLGLGEGSGIAVLAGEWAPAAPLLAPLVSQVQLLVLNAPASVPTGDRISAIAVLDTLPVAAGSVRGVALDSASATPALLAGAVRALRSGGRLIAPASAPVPDGVTELARDDELWVAERDPAATFVPLRSMRKR